MPTRHLAAMFLACYAVPLLGSSIGTHLLLGEIAAAADVDQGAAAVIVPLLADNLTRPKDTLELQAGSDMLAGPLRDQAGCMVSTPPTVLAPQLECALGLVVSNACSRSAKP